MTDQPTEPTPDSPIQQPIDPGHQDPSVGGSPGGHRILPPNSGMPRESIHATSRAHGGPTFAPGTDLSSGLDWTKVAVPLVAALVAVLAIFWFATGPEDGSFADVRDGIESTDDLNNESTAGAPQQEVVNGWTTIEYLNLLSTQQEHENNRRDALLLLLLLSGLAAYTHHHFSTRRLDRSSPVPAKE